MRQIRCLKLVKTGDHRQSGEHILLSTAVGFLPDILEILKALPPKSKKWRGMCFSATFPAKIQEVISCVLDSDYTSISTIDPSEVPTVEGVPQFFIVIPTVVETFATLLSLIRHEITASTKEPKIIVFGITAAIVSLYAKFFDGQTDLRVFELHSRMTQQKRTRTTSDFKAAKNGIIFATDGRLAPLQKFRGNQLKRYCSHWPGNGFSRCFSRCASWSSC